VKSALSLVLADTCGFEPQLAERLRLSCSVRLKDLHPRGAEEESPCGRGVTFLFVCFESNFFFCGGTF
jgi:hypothetical protein